MDAPNKVFSICELAEAILIHLPLYDLVLATTVCQNFRGTLLSSVAIRERLQNDPLPVFAQFVPGRSSTEDLCNVNENTTWFFRTRVAHGIVITLRTVNRDIQLYVPDDPQRMILRADSKQTKVSTVPDLLPAHMLVHTNHTGCLLCNRPQVRRTSRMER